MKIEPCSRSLRIVLPLALVLAVVVPATPASEPISAIDASPDKQPWMAVAASGTVEARLTASAQVDWDPVARGDQLRPAMLVRTGRSGRATLSRNASLLIIDPRSQVELPATPRPGMETSVIQRNGSVLYEVDSREDPHFEVVTPYLVAGVKGTQFLVTIHEDYTAVTVRSGLVEVTHPDTGELRGVRAGETLIRERHRDEMELIDGRRANAENKRLGRLNASAPGSTAPGEPGFGPGHYGTGDDTWPGGGIGTGAHHGAADTNAFDNDDAHGHAVGLPDEIDTHDEADSCGSAVSVCDPGDVANPGNGTTKPPGDDPDGDDPDGDDPDGDDPDGDDPGGDDPDDDDPGDDDPIFNDPIFNDPIARGGAHPAHPGVAVPSSSDTRGTEPSESMLMLLNEQSADHERLEEGVERDKNKPSERRGRVRRAR